MKAATQLCQCKTIFEELDTFSLSHHDCIQYYPALKCVYFNHNIFSMKQKPNHQFS